MKASAAAFAVFDNIADLQPPTYSIRKPSTGWWEQAERRLESLLKLPDGWDGYDGVAVKFANVFITTTILNGICRDSTPLPDFVPVSRGGLQIEWHTADVDIEIYIANPTEIHALRSFVDGRPDEEVAIRNNFAEIVPWIRDLETAIASATAAA